MKCVHNYELIICSCDEANMDIFPTEARVHSLLTLLCLSLKTSRVCESDLII